MNTQKLLTMVLMIAFVVACNLPALNTPLEAAPTEITSEAVAAGPPPATEIAIQHTIIPVDLPVERSSHAGDYDTSLSAGKKAAEGGDRFTFGRFERPFNANTMDLYFSQLDIVDTYVFQDETWIYGTMTMKDLKAKNEVAARYAIELDLDVDGKGDWLIVASAPTSTEWSVEGVQAFEDANNGVGDLSAMYTDKNVSGDGYEALIFDQGNGDDPDAAWVRISPGDPNVIEISVKLSILGNPEKYMINMWAGTSLLDPALFDLNDHFSHEQAGAADTGLEIFYPIKEVFEIDNSCKMAVGFQPIGQEPGLCEVFIPVVPGATLPGCSLTYSICQSQGYGSFDSASCSCIPIG